MRHLYIYGLKGHKALSPGHRPGGIDVSKFALKGQKPICRIVAFAPTGRMSPVLYTQGVALG